MYSQASPTVYSIDYPSTLSSSLPASRDSFKGIFYCPYYITKPSAKQVKTFNTWPYNELKSYNCG